MIPADREQWIVAWLRKRPGQSVSTLDTEFVGAYIDATKEPFKPQMFGA